MTMTPGGSTSFLRIADITIGVRYADPSLFRELPEAVSRFAVHSAGDEVLHADVRLDVDLLEGTLPAPPRMLFDSGAVWRLYADVGSGYRIDCQAEMFGDEPYKLALFDADFTRGRILVRKVAEENTMHPLDYPLDEVLIANLLARGRGVELHGCGIIDTDGRGHLFVGQSGAGKTTTARVWTANVPGVEIVSDDRVIVRESGGELRMFGTPWHGEAALSTPSSAPLAGIYLLKQAAATELADLTHADAAASLFGCTFPLFWDSAALGFTLQMLERIATLVPVRTLRFTPDASVIDAVRRDA
ncbi:MAG: hypothetical protein JWO56_2475 [Acidobacteria bacterium]|nr:hypothetical protein [Acidobacteriota bacterium]